MSEQQGSVGGAPNFALTKVNTFAQTPNLSAFIGHVPFEEGPKVGQGMGTVGIGGT
jgi:hypothetical protein